MISANSVASSIWDTGVADFLSRQQFLYFLRLPHGQGALRPIFTVWDASRESRQP
jgi:hypothetical protein